MGGEQVEAATEADPAWLALHAEREALERALTLAQARVEESDLLVNLDRVLTLIRAAEYRRRPGARRW